MGGVDIFIASVGTGGTITGVGSYLKMMNKDIKVTAEYSRISLLLASYITYIFSTLLTVDVLQEKFIKSRSGF